VQASVSVVREKEAPRLAFLSPRPRHLSVGLRKASRLDRFCRALQTEVFGQRGKVPCNFIVA
jgi:hypothetical protein